MYKKTTTKTIEEYDKDGKITKRTIEEETIQQDSPKLEDYIKPVIPSDPPYTPLTNPWATPTVLYKGEDKTE